MKAYQVTKFGAPLELKEMETPKPVGTEVLIKVRRAGVCHSDLHIQDGFYDLGNDTKLDLATRGISFPHTLGHELYGDIVSGGPDAGDLPIGEGRLVHPWIGCGECKVCLAGNENLCLAPRFVGVFQNGAYAEYCLISHPRFLIDIGDLDPSVATPYSCSGVTVYSALRKAQPINADEWLVVMGAGGLGLNAVAIAKGMGIEKVLAVDLDDAKLAAATEMGATAVLNSSSGNVTEMLQQMTDGGPQAIVDTVGAEATAHPGIASLVKGGRYVIVGLFGGELKMALPTIPMRALSVMGSYTGNLAELKELIALAKTGKVKALPVETRPLAEASNTLDDLRNGKIVGRVVLTD